MENNNSHIKKLEHDIGKLQNEVSELKYAETINQVLFEISNAVNTSIDLEELYKLIHEFLKKLLPLPNFFISIVDKKNDLLYFPYHQDSKDSFDGSDVFTPRSFKIPSLTREVILGEKPLFHTKEALKERAKKGSVCGAVPAVWIGAPLLISGQVMGVMAMYSYDNPDIFTQQNMDLFISISNQVALAIDRKYAIEKLRDSEETFRALIENSNDVVMRFDRLYRHLYVSPSVRTLGIEPEDMVGKTHAELGFSLKFSNQWEKEIENVFLTKQSGRIEFYLPNGIWYDWLLFPEFSSKGEVVAVITSARDITERKRLELQRTSLNKINQIIISSTNLDNMFDNALKEILEVFECDRAWVGHFNLNTYNFKILNEYTLPEWPGAVIKNIQISMSKKTIDEILKRAENSGLALFNKQTISMLDRVTEIEYEVKSMMLLPVHIEDNVLWLFGLHQCSEERIWTLVEQDFFKQVGQRISDGLNNLLLHRKLKDAKNYIDSIIDSMPSLLIGVNVQLEITGLNLKAETDAGVKASEVEGNKLHAVFPNLKPHLGKIMQALEEEKIIEKTKIPRYINGNFCYENITIFPLVDETVKGAVVRIDEVTERVRLEEMMIRSEKMLSVGGLAAGMAHEINNPLAGMMQNAQVVQNRLLKDFPANIDAAIETGTSMEVIRNYLSKRKIPGMLEDINKAGVNAAQIVKNMLSFAHGDTVAHDYNNLSDIIEATIDLAQYDYDLKKKYDFKDVTIIREYEADLPNVLCEASMIQQVIFNVLKNGTEAMFDKFDKLDKSGRSNKTKPQFRIRLYKDGEMACIEIQDNGTGMSDDVAKRIFDPFYTTKDPDKGTGLGLSVSYFIIAENHKGEITVESTPGYGSTFFIKLLCG